MVKVVCPVCGREGVLEVRGKADALFIIIMRNWKKKICEAYG